MFQKSYLEQLLSPKKYSKEVVDHCAKDMAIGFFKWNAEKVGTYVIYLTEIQKMVKSIEIEENLVKFEGATLEERYDMYVEYLKNKDL